MHLALNRAYAFGMLALLALAIVATAVLVGSPGAPEMRAADSSDFAGASGSATCTYYNAVYGWRCRG